jgi:hypothetical protein
MPLFGCDVERGAEKSHEREIMNQNTSCNTHASGEISPESHFPQVQAFDRLNDCPIRHPRKALIVISLTIITGVGLLQNPIGDLLASTRWIPRSTASQRHNSSGGKNAKFDATTGFNRFGFCAEVSRFFYIADRGHRVSERFAHRQSSSLIVNRFPDKSAVSWHKLAAAGLHEDYMCVLRQGGT